MVISLLLQRVGIYPSDFSFFLHDCQKPSMTPDAHIHWNSESPFVFDFGIDPIYSLVWYLWDLKSTPTKVHWTFWQTAAFQREQMHGRVLIILLIRYLLLESRVFSNYSQYMSTIYFFQQLPMLGMSFLSSFTSFSYCNSVL